MMKSMVKRLGYTFIIASLALVLLVAAFPLCLVKNGNRQNSYTLPEPLSVKVSNETKGMDMEQIIDYSLSLTATKLRFAVLNDIDNGRANCVGYARMCAAICNHALGVNGIEGKATPVVGYIESSGINWCQVLKAIAPKARYKNFVKDHDFVELTVGSQIYYFDPSIYDILGNKCLTATNLTINNK